ncbi:MAG TPA: tRNA-dihydrouridine synthase family protein [Candidatus Absconditabacterales bacterium]|nr:tRNA-dihydrouridine synthase family protein [Candidatus Absconditabacterales bacterium]
MIIGLAPMDGITDLPYRVITKEIFDKYNINPKNELRLWTEFMTSDGYIANPHKVIKHMIHTDFEKPIIIQIFGGKIQKLIKTALDIQQKYGKNIAGIELNTGCPANNVMKNGGGSALLTNKDELLDTIKEISTKLDIPFSIKTRTGLNEDDKKEQMNFLIEASKYCHMISVHSRTLQELYKGDGDRNFIYELKNKVNKNCKIIGNGAIKDYEEIVGKIKNLDGIMIGQAAIGNPWIFTPHKPSLSEIYNTILKHLELMAKYEIFTSNISQDNLSIETINPDLKKIENIDIEKNYKKIHYTPLLFRKYLHQYLKGIPGGKELKELCNKTTDLKENIKYIQNFFEKII